MGIAAGELTGDAHKRVVLATHRSRGWVRRWEDRVRRIPEPITEHARALRNGATDAERLIWRRVAQYRPRFTRQLVVGPYIIDLACRTARLAIELDGSQHIDAASYDARRTAYLEDAGWVVLRFWNNDVMANPDGVADAILARAAERLGTAPQPVPSRTRRPHSPP